MDILFGFIGFYFVLNFILVILMYNNYIESLNIWKKITAIIIVLSIGILIMLYGQYKNMEK